MGMVKMGNRGNKGNREIGVLPYALPHELPWVLTQGTKNTKPSNNRTIEQLNNRTMLTINNNALRA